MGTPNYYVTVAFEVELLPNEGECLLCQRWHAPLHRTQAKFAVRNHDGEAAVAVCEYHVAEVMLGWSRHIGDE